MSKFIFASALVVLSLFLFASDNRFIRSSDFDRPQEIQTRYGCGSVFITIKSANVKDLGNGMIEATIQYEVRNSLGANITRYQIDFDIENSNYREIAELKDRQGVIRDGETKTETITRQVYTKRSNPTLDISGVKIELDDVYTDAFNSEIDF